MASHVRVVHWTLGVVVLGLFAGSRLVQAYPPIEMVRPERPQLPEERNGEPQLEPNPAVRKDLLPNGHIPNGPIPKVALKDPGAFGPDHLAPNNVLAPDYLGLRRNVLGTSDPVVFASQGLHAQLQLMLLDESAGRIAAGMRRQAPLALQVHGLFKESDPVTTVDSQQPAWPDGDRQTAQQLAQRIVLKAMEEVVAERPAVAADATEYKQRLIDSLKHADRRATRAIGGGVWAKVLDEEFPSTTYQTRVLEPASQPGELDYRVEAVGLPRTTTKMNVDAFAANAVVYAAARQTTIIVPPTERDATRTP